MKLETLELQIVWDSSNRVFRLFPDQRWWFELKWGVRKSAVPKAQKWFNPYLYIRFLGLGIGTGLAVSEGVTTTSPLITE